MCSFLPILGNIQCVKSATDTVPDTCTIIFTICLIQTRIHPFTFSTYIKKMYRLLLVVIDQFLLLKKVQRICIRSQ